MKHNKFKHSKKTGFNFQSSSRGEEKPSRTKPSLRISCCFLGLTCFLKMWPSSELWLWFSWNSSGFTEPGARSWSRPRPRPPVHSLGNARAFYKRD
ncbi:hypothetical protein INR49_023227 [Caranx melampygus]|nr:hypothetical protein INR49_023227 [Caranx melampygus]